MPRSLLLRAADRLTDHPGPTVTLLQREVMAGLLCVAFGGIALGRHLWRVKDALTG